MAAPAGTTTQPTDRDLASMHEARTLARAARRAQEQLAELSQVQIDAIVEAMAEAVTPHAEALARLAVEETGYGVVADKVQKNLFASVRVREFIRPMKTVGVVARHDDTRVVDIAEPFGVVAAVVPSTNPTSTAIYKALIAVKARCAIVVSPHPSAARCITRTATVMHDAARDAEAAKAPPVTGDVLLGGETRVVVEPDEEFARVYYLLDIINQGRTPVSPATPFTFDAPTGAASVTLMEGSSPLATVAGTRVRVNGPFPPGATFVQVAYSMPLSGGTLDIAQTFPARIERLGLIAKKVGDARLSSPQIERQQEMPAGGFTYIAAAGGAVAAGQPIRLTLSGMPHHSSVPLWVTLGVAGAVLLAGLVAVGRSAPATTADDRKHLIARREKLFEDLVRLEADHRRGRIEPARYADRREGLVAALEHVYGALESDDASPDPSGLAA